MSPDEDPLLAALAALPDPPESPARADALRRAARKELLAEHALAGRPTLALMVHAWNRALLPALVTGAVASYTLWCLAYASSLYR
jgi:hypothetical protein